MAGQRRVDVRDRRGHRRRRRLHRVAGGKTWMGAHRVWRAPIACASGMDVATSARLLQLEYRWARDLRDAGVALVDGATRARVVELELVDPVRCARLARCEGAGLHEVEVDGAEVLHGL